MVNLNEQSEWERLTKTHDSCEKAYSSNKLVVCSIVKASIESYFTERLEKHAEFVDKQDDLVWLLKMIKLFCSFNTEEKYLTLTVIDAQFDFLHFRQSSLTLLRYKRLFQQKLSALRDNKMALGAVEALMSKFL
uniref:Uncharacterized protein n=1 Tax=Leptocylindrus danicus TaxID=163516 RepID=A0A7S2LD77_9STRA|mmetsp:Transcript_4142/g.6046  ORF Transcript_4142/g.6046 Transcript_4142/m.6046 type:complete len:134 (+) Transcript_4142:312-713(+)